MVYNYKLTNLDKNCGRRGSHSVAVTAYMHKAQMRNPDLSI
jgi:hypothetical protein